MRCPECDTPNPPRAVNCRECGEPLPRRRRPDDEDDDGGDETVATIIPYRNARALTAYYLGIFGLLPILGLFLGPAALILGIMGLRYAREHPKAHGTAHAVVGIVLGAIDTLYHLGIIVIILIIALVGK